jgi:hypothetical protein
MAKSPMQTDARYSPMDMRFDRDADGSINAGLEGAAGPFTAGLGSSPPVEDSMPGMPMQSGLPEFAGGPPDLEPAAVAAASSSALPAAIDEPMSPEIGLGEAAPPVIGQQGLQGASGGAALDSQSADPPPISALDYEAALSGPAGGRQSDDPPPLAELLIDSASVDASTDTSGAVPPPMSQLEAIVSGSSEGPAVEGDEPPPLMELGR